MPSWFPGLYCPGLIEAGRVGMAHTMTRRGFRGSIAPASLKRRGPVRVASDAAGFPGLYCPGLIEALPRQHHPPVGRGFPGLYCPGLIEAEPSWRDDRPKERFRGSIAPASLKRALHDPAGATGAWFPGLYCPGLIEAGAVLCLEGRGDPSFRGSIAPASLKQYGDHEDKVIPVSVSGALLPRPH